MSALEDPAALGTAPLGRLLWHACTQTTMSVGTYGIYALTNAWFVARGVGPVAFAAVNTVAPVLLVVGAVAAMVGAGGASLVSRSLGAGDTAAAARAAGNALMLFWTSAIAVAVTGIAVLDPLLTLLGATGELRGYARDYSLVILAGTVTATGFSSLVRAEGRMRFSTMLWVLPVLTQIALDPILIFGLHLGVRGAALGTVGGQSVSMGMSVWFFFGQRHRPYRIGLTELRPHARTLRQLVSIGSPSFLAGFGATLLATLANHLLLATGGAMVLAAWALCLRVGTFVTMPQLGIAQGLQPIVGFNAGRGAADRVARATTLALRATVAYGACVCIGSLAAAGPIMTGFTTDPDVHAQAVTAVRIVALSYPFAGIAPLFSARFQALGRAWPSYLISIGTILVVKVPLLAAFSRLGTTGVWAAFPVAELTSATITLLILGRARLTGAAGPIVQETAHHPRTTPSRG
jgi:putative MATE family efflux protein